MSAETPDMLTSPRGGGVPEVLIASLAASMPFEFGPDGAHMGEGSHNGAEPPGSVPECAMAKQRAGVGHVHGDCGAQESVHSGSVSPSMSCCRLPLKMSALRAHAWSANAGHPSG